MELDLIYQSTFGELDLYEKRKNEEVKYDRRRDAFIVYHLVNVHLKKGKGLKYLELLYPEDAKDLKKESLKESSIGTPQEMDAILGGDPVKGKGNPKASEMKKKFQELRKKKYGNK